MFYVSYGGSGRMRSWNQKMGADLTQQPGAPGEGRAALPSGHPIALGIQGIVLDAVGTLIEPMPPVARVYTETARRQGVELDGAVVQSRFRREFALAEVDAARGPLATDEPTERRRWRRIVGSVLPEVPDPDRAF